MHSPCKRDIWDKFDSATNRCKECYFVYRRNQKTETMKKLRAK